MSVYFDLYAEQRARTARLTQRRKLRWVPISGYEPSFDAMRDQYSADFSAAFDDRPFSEWAP